MIIIYNSGRFRMAGHGSLAGLLPYGNANGETILPSSESYLADIGCTLDIVVEMVSDSSLPRGHP